MRIIMAIDIIEGKCVRLTRGDFKTKKIYNEDPLEVALQIEDSGINYVHLVDLEGAKNKKIENIKVLEKIAWKTKLKIDFGGGLRSYEDLLTAFNAGARQVTAGSVAVTDPDTVSRMAHETGAGKTYSRSRLYRQESLNRLAGLRALIRKLSVLFQTTDQKVLNTRYALISKKTECCRGHRLLFIKRYLTAVKINLIASGGISSLKDIDTVKEAGCEGAIIGKAVYEGKITLQELGKYVKKTNNSLS